MNDTFECPFCHETHEVTGEHIWFPCLGGFSLNWLRCKDYIQLHYQNQEQHCWTVLAYHIAHKFNLISYAGAHRQPIDFEKVLKENILPTPIEQINNMVLFLGERSKFLGKNLDFDSVLTYQLNAWAGIINEENFLALIQALEEFDYISQKSIHSENLISVKLSLKGWEYFKSLQERNPESKQIFMAMKFEDNAKHFVNTHLKPLTQKLGFDLKLLDEIISEESLIDDKLRVEIKKSRLLICDLTHGNQGAYWEAGYAEGLGISVLYICSKTAFNSKTTKPHFDVNHQEIFTWADDESSIADFKEQLKAKIALLTQ